MTELTPSQRKQKHEMAAELEIMIEDIDAIAKAAIQRLTERRRRILDELGMGRPGLRLVDDIDLEG